MNKTTETILELNKPKKEWGIVANTYTCTRCSEVWKHDHIKTCNWYAELKKQADQ